MIITYHMWNTCSCDNHRKLLSTHVATWGVGGGTYLIINELMSYLMAYIIFIDVLLILFDEILQCWPVLKKRV